MKINKKLSTEMKITISIIVISWLVFMTIFFIAPEIRDSIDRAECETVDNQLIGGFFIEGKRHGLFKDRGTCVLGF